MAHTKVLNRALNYDGSTIEIVEILHDRPIPGVGDRSYAVNHKDGSIGAATYADARRIVTGHNGVSVVTHDIYGTEANAVRKGFGLADAMLSDVDTPYRAPEAVAAPQFAPVATVG